MEKWPIFDQNHGPTPLEKSQFSAASFPVVLGDFGCDVTRQACRENSPRTIAIALGSKPPLATRIARTGLGTRLSFLDFLNFFFLQPKKRFFVLEYRKIDFSSPILLERKKMEKWPIFLPKPWTNPFVKILNFRLS